jgi:hypothetical protein
MNTRDMANGLDPASEAILRAQREMLLRLGSELLSSQRAALASVQAEMDETSRDLAQRTKVWRRRTLGTVSLSAGLLVPWLLLLGFLGAVTLVLGARARDAWSDYRAAEAAVERLRVSGAVPVMKDDHLYVRVDPDSLSRGQRGNWYARAADVQLRHDAEGSTPRVRAIP